MELGAVEWFPEAVAELQREWCVGAFPYISHLQFIEEAQLCPARGTREILFISGPPVRERVSNLDRRQTLPFLIAYTGWDYSAGLV